MDKRRLGWRVVNAAASPREADILLFDVIGGDGFWEDGTTAADFVKELIDLKGNVDLIRFHINSPGGYVDDALAMYQAILDHPATTEAHIITAYSAASFVALAADKRLIAKTGKVMIHDALTYAYGNASDMRALADRLDAESENIASIYADRAGGQPADWRSRMQANGKNGTEYRGQQAVDVGLVQELMPASKNEYSERIAALVTETTAPTNPEPSAQVIDFAAAIRAARLESPTPTLQQLLETQSSLSTALKGA
jgi:ATP-dependent protease ClpP protease subunit